MTRLSGLVAGMHHPGKRRNLFMNIFVGNLAFKTSEEELKKEFEVFGEVHSVKIIMDHETHKSRGFAFVEMRDQDQATAAIAGMNGKELAGQVLKVNEAKPRTPRSEQGAPRGSAGGFAPAGRQGRSPTGFGIRDRINSAYQNRDDDIYDTKGGRSGGNRGRGGRGFDSGGRSGGGKRSR
jgi:RNA recognition motif-containing protein